MFLSALRRKALKYRSENVCNPTEMPRSTFVGPDTEIRQGSGIGPIAMAFYNPYDLYCIVQAQIGDALAIGRWTPSVIQRADLFFVKTPHTEVRKP